MLLRCGLALVVVVLPTLLAGSNSALAAEQEQAQANLKEKHVLFLPLVNTTGEKWEELRTRIEAEVTKTIVTEMTAHKYTFVTDEELKKVVESSQIDLGDEETWRRETFYNLAQAAGAEYVIFAVITSATQRTRSAFWAPMPEGDVTIKFWILNARTKTPILSAKSINAKARPKTNVFGEAKGSDCQVDAAGRVARDALKQAFDLPKKSAKGN